MREERKIVVKLLEAEQTNTYKILAEFLARKFIEKGFDTEDKKWFNNDVPKISELLYSRSPRIS